MEEKFTWLGKDYRRIDIVAAVELVMHIKLDNMPDRQILGILYHLSDDEYLMVQYLLN